MRKFVNGTLALAWALLWAAAAWAGPGSPLDVRLETASPIVHGDADVVVRVSIANPTRRPVVIQARQLPGEDDAGALFRITRDGKRIAYTGAIVKRGPAQPADLVRIDPGEVVDFDVELSASYDLSQDGHYVVEYAGRGDGTTELRSPPLDVWIHGRTASLAPPPPKAAAVAAPSAGGSLSYSACSATQQSKLVQAMQGASAYASNAYGYLATYNSASARYKKWFGTPTATNWSTVSAHFGSLADAFQNKPVTIDCSCKKSYYAYVYPSQPYRIYVCKAFWSAPMTGTDSKAGTLIHEMSHFYVVASTDDWAYGQTAAASLAVSNPTKAIDNADSHEYFAENTPALQ